MTAIRTILLVGEQAVGKTHYGAQSLKRLMVGDGDLKMDGHPEDIEPYEEAFNRLSAGLAATHTPTTRYVESRWPVITGEGLKAELFWPDYGGEQVLEITRKRSLAPDWVERASNSDAWVFMVRVSQTRHADDVFSRPLEQMVRPDTETTGPVELSDQARLVELLQLLLYSRGAKTDRPVERPRLTVLLSCWDELVDPKTPMEELQRALPLLAAFVRSNWQEDSLDVMGVSALERPLDAKTPDKDFARLGPEAFGYIILPGGEKTVDLLAPLTATLRAIA